MKELILEKGASAVLCVWNCENKKYTPVKASIKAKRVTKNGHITYWVVRKDFGDVGRTYNEYGFANFKDWRDAALVMHPSFLCATMKEAKKACK